MTDEEIAKALDEATQRGWNEAIDFVLDIIKNLIDSNEYDLDTLDELEFQIK